MLIFVLVVLVSLLVREILAAPPLTTKGSGAVKYTETLDYPASISSLRRYKSSGARRLHLLIRPFGDEYNSIIGQRGGQSQVDFSMSGLPSRGTSVQKGKGKASMVATTDPRLESQTPPSDAYLGESSAPYRTGGPRSLLRLEHTPAVRTTGDLLDKYNRAQQFDRVWRKQKLGTHLDASKLADEVVSMRLHGVNSKTAGVFAREAVRAKGDREYEIQYQTRAKELNEHYFREAAALEKDGYLSKLPDRVKGKMILDATFKRAEAATAKKRKRGARSTSVTDVAASKAGPLAKNARVHQDIEDVGAHIRKELRKDGLDFNTMPLAQLEERARGMSMTTHTPTQFSKHFYRYAQIRRGENKWDMESIRRNRKTSANKEDKRLKTAKAKRDRAGLAAHDGVDNDDALYCLPD